MAPRSRDIRWEGPGGPFIGYLAWDDATDGPRPGVLICPAFIGRSPIEEARARDLAQLGYAVLVMDYYGGGRMAGSREEASAWQAMLDADRPLLATRMEVALGALRAQDIVDAARCAAMGYCFGGKGVLDLAREGADLCGVVSFHGVLDRAPSTPHLDITSEVLVCHGWSDPLAPPDAVATLAAELDAHGARWQLHAYGHTGHAFTNPAMAPGARPGFAFDAAADRRIWRAMTAFLEEVFQPRPPILQ